MNMSKTKVMMENDNAIYVNNTQIENIYPGQSYTSRDKNQDKEMQRRITQYVQGQHWNILEETSLQLMHTSINAIRAETGTLSSYTKNKLAAA